ncbi:MAG TPA: hypothetical protein VLW83_06285 [Candidatus Acidoferrales bacterium]|nr:hypothetical protein [Candidatus Acidoferrales bacterium]
MDEQYMKVKSDEGTVFHYPPVPVGTVVTGAERGRRIARLLDRNNFIFNDLTLTTDGNSAAKVLRKGRYLHPAIIATIYKMFIKGGNGGGYSDISIMEYAGPTHRSACSAGSHDGLSDDDIEAAEQMTLLYLNGLQGPNAKKRIIDEIPRTVLALVAAVIRWVLCRYDCLGNLPTPLPEMALNDDFVNEVEFLIRRTMGGVDMAMITREVKRWPTANNGLSGAPRIDEDDDVVSD